MSEKPLVFLDMDGVLCNFIQGMIDSHGWKLQHDEYVELDYHRKLGLTDEQFWKPSLGFSWWLELREYSWARDLFESLNEVADVVICSSPSNDTACASQKLGWLSRRGFLATQTSADYMLGSRKELLAKSGGILIDDSERNVGEFRRCGGRAILFPQPWNENRDILDRRLAWVYDELELFGIQVN